MAYHTTGLLCLKCISVLRWIAVVLNTRVACKLETKFRSGGAVCKSLCNPPNIDKLPIVVESGNTDTLRIKSGQNLKRHWYISAI